MPLLKGIAWDHPRGFNPMIACSNEFKKTYPDIDIVWEKRPLQAFADRPIEQMAYDYDLMVIDHPHVGEASRKGLLLELDNYSEYKEDLDSFLKYSVGSSHISYNFNDHQYALAIDAAAPVSCYRKDLIEYLPETFEEIILLAEKKNNVMWPIKPVDSISSFNSIAANLGNAINKKHGSFIDRKIGISILEMMKKLADLIRPICLSMNPIETLEYMSMNDDIAYCPLLYGYSNYSRKGFKNSIITFSNMPSFDENKSNHSGSQIGGTGLAISKKSKFSKIALEYSFWVAGKKCQKNLFYDSGGQPSHLQSWKDTRINENSNNFFLNTLETLENSWLRPRYDGYMYFQDIAGSLINSYLKGELLADITIIKMESEFEKSLYVNQK